MRGSGGKGGSYEPSHEALFEIPEDLLAIEQLAPVGLLQADGDHPPEVRKGGLPRHLVQEVYEGANARAHARVAVRLGTWNYSSA
jgi:hypothetical protein